MISIVYIFLGVFLAGALFWVRSNNQIFYGVVEIVTGLVLMIFAVYTPVPGDFSSDFSNDFNAFHYTIKLTAYLGATFVMVRGCDTIKQGWQKRQ
jgi:uncharacterized membrane protein HdeD (DUF308 family)